jgi:hypothetical protein
MIARSLASLALRFGLRVEAAPLQRLHINHSQLRHHTTVEDAAAEVKIAAATTAPTSQCRLTRCISLMPCPQIETINDKFVEVRCCCMECLAGVRWCHLRLSPHICALLQARDEIEYAQEDAGWSAFHSRSCWMR